MTATIEFERHFRALESAMNIEGQLSGSVSEKFETLLKLADDRAFGSILSEYGGSRWMFLRNLSAVIPAREEIERRDISSQVIDLIFHQLVVAVSYRYYHTPSIPKIHHWLPISYTRHFTGQVEPKKGLRNRRAEIQAITFTADGESIETTVSDRHFAHGVDAAGNGFYHLNVEYFFGKIEAAAAEARDKMSVKVAGGANESFFYAATAAFFIVQSVRNPHPKSKQFSIRTLSGVIEALIEALNHVPAIYSSAPRVNVRLAFTPYVPARIRELANGNRIYSFPMSSNRAFVVSKHPISRRSARGQAQASNRAVIHQARKTSSMIFGIGHKHVYEDRLMKGL